MLHHPSVDSSTAAPKQAALPKKRGSYNCGRCGLPKKGHTCPSADGRPAPLVPRSGHGLRRALFSDEDRGSSALVPAPVDEEVAGTPVPEVVEEEEEEEDEVDWTEEAMILPTSCMVEVLKRLSPKELMRAAAVCRGWRGCVRRMWRSAEELRLSVSPRSQIGFVGSLLQKCSGLSRLTLRMESDVDATMLACVVFSLPNLEAFEINMTKNTVNRITGNELSRFVAEKRCLTTLKVEGCTNIGFLNISSSSLSTLWLSNLYCISKMVFKCPNLREISLDFARQENDSTDLVTMMENLGRSCPKLTNIHIASIQLCNEAVLALTSANLRCLRMLSLVLGSRITDAAVTSIVSCYTSLELLDLSGSSISDSGIRMLCKVLPETLSRLLLALCPNITSSGIQFAAVQLPLLQLIDCGMSISDTGYHYESSQEKLCPNIKRSGEYTMCQKLSTMKSQRIYQKLIIKHANLRKLSLWGCSGLDALYLNCPELNDLNLNSCTNLHPERLLLRCPNLKDIHASGCQDMLIGAIRNQVLNEFVAVENHLPCKRLADGSKRVQVPLFIQQISDGEKQKRRQMTHCIVHHV
ncbi:F-box LRR-repeat protein [Musa troglodytarum]|uniref:F-box LRR-repeat protein n=1 Tax=Musa troglodytarum TaxID=320322 RepID=A0A9E7JZF7_9LILI|nr:F-box LRR-repeat protein [Musa troglodytarum]URD99347.1 F-box LRR-repeat protein [Musa troglodytarum]